MNNKLKSATGISLLLAVIQCSSGYAVEPISVSASADDGNVPANTLDNALSTRWSAKGDGQYIRYDLGENFNIDSIDIAFFKGDQRLAVFDVQTSQDASTWTTVFNGNQTESTIDQVNYELDASVGRYVQIIGYGNSSNEWNSITEVDVNTSDIDVCSTNCDSGELTASASSNDGNGPENVIDNDLDTRWSANGDGEWLMLDLGSSQLVAAVNVAFYKGDQRSASFDLETSSDNVTWNTALSGVTSSGDSLELESFALDGVTARYVRYVGYGNSSSSWNSLTEMSVSTEPNTIPTVEPTTVPTTEPTAEPTSVPTATPSFDPGDGNFDPVITTTVDSLNSVIASAAAGSDIVVTGSGEISLKNISFSSPTRIRASSIGGVTLTNATINNSNNIVLQGFVFGPNDESTYLKVVNSTNIQILRNQFDHTGVRESQSAIVLTQASQYITIGYNEFGGKDQMFQTDGSKLTGSYIKTQYDAPDMSKNVHIHHNYFHDILPYVTDGVTPAGDSDREAIAMGIADSQSVVSNNIIEYNLFDNCDGENEIITVKTSGNVFRYNTFKNSMGSLSFRLGTSNEAYGNYFYGVGAGDVWSDDNFQTGGVRVYGSGHKIYDNYMEGLTGTTWRRPILIDSGDTSNSVGNDSHQVASDVEVYNNIIINSAGGGIHVGGDNYSKMPFNITIDGNVVIGSEGILFNNTADQSSNFWNGNQAYATGSAEATSGGTLSSSEVEVLSSAPSVSKPTALTASDVGPYAE